MPDLSAYGFSLIPGPGNSQALLQHELLTPLPVKNASDPASRTWEWREALRPTQWPLSGEVTASSGEASSLTCQDSFCHRACPP